MAFTQKHLDFTFELAQGNFGQGGNKAEVKGHRATVDIDQPGGADMSKAAIAIWGMPLQLMNQLTTLGNDINAIGKNFVSIQAYEDGGQKSYVYKGTIMAAYADLRAQPQGCFRVEALVGYYEAVMPATPTSAPGSQDVAQLFKQIADKAELQFENNGVNVKVANPYLPGNPRVQMKTLAQMAGVEWLIDRGKLAIWKAQKPRQGGPAMISADTGMVNYPTFNSSGIEVTTLYNPQVQYGGQITVKSQLTPACGDWYVYHVFHALDAELPNGRWFSTLSCSRTKT
ncbi:baseplate hub protein [Methylobacterium oryzae]|uniref:Uncharacterized protein n=1 Tax=Methylobacterium oryzae TaxID=334852 RepID=A0ABU7TI24_9HYPH